jgi:hypothetical protein
MRPTNETPQLECGASGDHRGGCSQEAFSPSALQAQILIAAHHVRPELAAMIAAFAFGGVGHA